MKIAHLEHICMMDETGCNASQNKDGLDAGEKKIMGVGDTPRTESNSADHRHTLPPMTSATGEATMDVRVRPEKDEMGETVVDEARVKMSLFVHKAECAGDSQGS